MKIITGTVVLGGGYYLIQMQARPSKQQIEKIADIALNKAKEMTKDGIDKAEDLASRAQAKRNVAMAKAEVLPLEKKQELKDKK